MKKLFFCGLLLAGCTLQTFAQNVGIGTTTPHANAILDVSSINKGLLLPRVADTNAVSGTKPAGLTIYSNGDNKLYFYNGTKWQSSSAPTSSDSLWYLKNNSINYTNRKFVGINTDLNLLPPQANLQVNGSILVQGATQNSNTAPSAGQTITMDNTNNTQTSSSEDSVNRVIDPAGSNNNYFNNMQGNVRIELGFGLRIGYKLSFNSSDFGLATGDTLWISSEPFPDCRTNYFKRFTNTLIAPPDFTINYNSNLNFVFRSDADGFNSNGFDITVTKIFSVQGNTEVTAVGNAFYFNPFLGSLRSGYSSGSVGAFSTAMGTSAATGYHSTAMGNATANGQYSTAIGLSTIANASYSTAIGLFNDPMVPPNESLPDGTFPVFIIGNGFNAGRGNAMVVYYNGNTDHNGNTYHNGFTRLGKSFESAPLIKMKEITGQNTSSVDGGGSSFAHGLTRSNIISVNVIVDAGGPGEVTHSYTYSPGFEFNVAFDNSNIYVYNKTGNCFSILNKPMKVLITYKE